MKKLYTKKIIIFIICIAISLISELFIFNFTGIRTFFSKNKNVEAKYYITSSNDNKINNILSNGNNTIFIDDISYPVTSINIEYNNYGNNCITYDTKYTAYGNRENSYELEKKSFNNTSNNYISFNTKKECYKITLTVNNYNEDLEISKIILNHPNFKFNVIRILINIIFNIFIYLIITKKIYKYNTKENPKLCYIIFSIIIILLLIFETIIFTKITTETNFEFFETNENELSSYNEIQKNNFDLQASKNIIQKNDKDNKYEYYSLYNNKIYAYLNRFSINFITKPVHIITGKYLTLTFINLLLLLSIIILSAIMYDNIIKYFIKKISIFNYILGYLLLILGSNILFARRSYIYDIAILSNIILEILCLIFIFILAKKNRKITLFLLGLANGLLIYTTQVGIIYVIFNSLITYILCKDKKLKLIECSNNKKNTKKDIKGKIKFKNINKYIPLFIYLTPIILFIILTLCTNYIQFNNILDYGYTHNVNVIDITYKRSTIDISYILKGILETIFIPPSIEVLRFPFSRINVIDNQYSEDEFYYNHNLLGIISFPVIYFLLIKHFLKYTNNQNIKTLQFINKTILLSFILLIFNILMNGISEIFTIETKYLLILSSIIFSLKYIEDNNLEYEKRNNFNTIFFILALINLYIVIPISISTDEQYLYNYHIPTVNTITNFIMF